MKKKSLPQLFDSIAPHYEFVNAALSFGLYSRWNAQLVSKLQRTNKILDLCCGTGLVTRSLISGPHQALSIDCLDLSQKMLMLAKQHMPAGIPVRYLNADAAKIPAENESYDGVVIAYGFRNIGNKAEVLKEIRRVLKPHGFCYVLELTPPPFPLKPFYTIYMNTIAPLIGLVLSGQFSPYRYLASSIANFSVDDLLAQFKNSGFIITEFSSLTYGVASLFSAQKTEE
jgi:demethylmenaquinone methyltransferase/2-methoxy-6-polyprenyl-1,4-benzoquinol methylase